MSNQVSNKSFIFSPEFDAAGIMALYGEDYTYIAEVFETVMADYDQLVQHIMAAYASKDIQALKSAVHKIKPVFGFVGLPAVQQQCQLFETICLSAPSFDRISSDFSSLRNKINSSKSIIEAQKTRLEEFNSQHP